VIAAESSLEASQAAAEASGKQRAKELAEAAAAVAGRDDEVGRRREAVELAYTCSKRRGRIDAAVGQNATRFDMQIGNLRDQDRPSGHAPSPGNRRMVAVSIAIEHMELEHHAGLAGFNRTRITSTQLKSTRPPASGRPRRSGSAGRPCGRMNASRKNGFVVTVSTRALNVAARQRFLCPMPSVQRLPICSILLRCADSSRGEPEMRHFWLTPRIPLHFLCSGPLCLNNPRRHFPCKNSSLESGLQNA
jgi:hypothetical protein